MNLPEAIRNLRNELSAYQVGRRERTDGEDNVAFHKVQMRVTDIEIVMRQEEARAAALTDENPEGQLEFRGFPFGMVAELAMAAAIVNRWLKWWLDSNECECENGHACGKTERAEEWERLDASLREVEKYRDELNEAEDSQRNS